MKFYWLFFIFLTVINFSCENKKNSAFEKKSSTDFEKELQKAKSYSNNYKIDSAKIILSSLTTTTIQKENPEIYIQAKLNLGKIESDQGNNVRALQHYQNALNIAETTDNSNLTPYIQKNIGVLYVQWKKFDKALEHYYLAKKLAKNTNNNELIADCKNNIGIIFEQQNLYNEALKAYDEALSYYQKQNLHDKTAMTYSNLAIIYKLQKNYQKAIEYNFKAIESLKITNDKWSEAAIYNNIGNLYGEIGNYKLAVKYCNKSLQIAKEINAEEIIGMAYESLANAAANVSDYKNAFNYHKEHAASINKFINQENLQQLSELNIKYESEKKQKEIVRTKLKSKQKNIWLIILASGFVIGIFVFLNFRNKYKQKQQQLFFENELLKEQTYSKIQEQRLEISQELHDSLGAQLTFINFTIDTIKKLNINLNEKLTSKINTLSDFSENSINELKNTLWILNSNDIYLEDLKTKILNFINNAAESTDDVIFESKFEIQSNLKISSKQAVNIFRTIQEITNNALKHASPSIIVIELSQKNNQLFININDNGKGFDYEDDKNKSFGLNNIFDRIKSINGEVYLTTKINQGTLYNIIINL